MDVYRAQVPLRPFTGSNVSKDSKKREVSNLEKVYEKVIKKFTNDNEKWISIQFKSSWLYFAMGNITFGENVLVESIDKQIKIRKKREYSVRRRIIEGDDISWRYMILLVIRITEEYNEVFDS